MKTRKLILLYVTFFLITIAQAQQPVIRGTLKELFDGPPSGSDHTAWLNEMKQWRALEKKKLNYSGDEYLRPELGWIKKTFIYAQMMAHDRYFYDPIARRYTVDRYLDDLNKRYGGLDAVLIWPTYPNIGIDDRNQFDLVHDMPGGIDALREMITDFKKKGVRVFFPIMIWDHGTRKISLTMPVALLKEMKKLGADGLNGDTMWGVTEDFRDAYDSLQFPVALEPEVAIKDLKMVEWNTMSWGYWWSGKNAAYDYKPGVSVYKWLEPRHQVQVTNRWAVDKTDDLQYAFFNGVGYNAWENIWGIWNQIPKRYSEIIRRIATIYREFPNIWSSAEWEPYFPTVRKGVFASKFPGLDKTIYTLVNRDSSNVSGIQLELPYHDDLKYFDLWNGVELTAQKTDNRISLNFSIEGRGFGAVLAIKDYAVSNDISHFLKMEHEQDKPLDTFSASWDPLPQKIVRIEAVKFKRNTRDMVLIPEINNYDFESKGIMIEGDNLPLAVGVQHPWEKHPSRNQKNTMKISSFYMDKYPVTNQQFKKFLDASSYQPADNHNFLKDWTNGMYPKGWDKKPVTWVSIEDARAYAKWAGKRLPHEWEWQYAAQGSDGRLYPWGNQFDSTLIPTMDSSRNMRPPTNVNDFPKGVSPFGVMDMVGNVWQWTDEYEDDHTRSAILKGGGYYRATTSHWYFPRTYKLNEYGKYLLMAPSLDRSGSIGFRCVIDRK